MLKKHLTETESKEIIAIAASNNVRPLHLTSIDTWFGGTSLSRTMDVDMKSQPISDLLDRIGSSDLYRQFSRDMISRINPGNSLLYDITSLPSYGVSGDVGIRACKGSSRSRADKPGHGPGEIQKYTAVLRDIQREVCRQK